jgi:hypothetical protein
MAIDTKKFEKGKCFICSKECDKDAYCHIECSYAYSDEKQKRINEANKKQQSLKAEDSIN